ncbi:MAG: NYN domain-containing protein [Patescibacteria group bacterium]
MSKIDLSLKLISKKRVSLFIDAANILYSQQSLGWRIDYRKLKKYFKDNASLKKAYFYSGKISGNNKQENFFKLMKKFGYLVKTKEVKWIKDSNGKILKGKGNLDVELALDLTHTASDFDTAILLSGDSDFASAVSFIKSLGKIVIVISSRNHISRELINVADLYLPFDKLKKYIKRSS